MVNKNIGGAVITFLDVSELKAMEDKLDNKDQQLQRSYQDLDEFAYFSAHDLRGLFRGFSNHLHALNNEIPQLTQNDHWLSLKNDGETLNRIIDCLIRFSNIGQMDLNLEKVDFNELLESIIDIFKGKDCRFYFETDLPRIVTDKSALSFVLESVIRNGIFYNESKQKIIEVGFLDPDVETTTFYIRDNGSGVPEGMIENVFKMFKQLDRSDPSKRGVGVGLSFSRRFVERLGGKIWLESEEKVGTTVYVQLPIIADEKVN